jgi:hypothetical protein
MYRALELAVLTQLERCCATAGARAHARRRCRLQAFVARLAARLALARSQGLIVMAHNFIFAGSPSIGRTIEPK